MGAEVFHALKKVLVKRKLSTGVGDEGGFAPDLASDEQAIEVVIEAIEAAGYAPGQAGRARDRLRRVGALRQGQVHVQEERRRYAGRRRDDRAVRASWLDKYPIVSIEDGLAEDDWDGWANLTQRARRPRAARGRRHLRDEHGVPLARHRRGRRERDPHQGQPDRHRDRDARDDGTRAAQRLPEHRVAPQRRDRGHVHRRPRRRDQRGADQDGLGVAHRSRGEVQPAPAHRGRPGGHVGVPRRLRCTGSRRPDVAARARGGRGGSAGGCSFLRAPPARCGTRCRGASTARRTCSRSARALPRCGTTRTSMHHTVDSLARWKRRSRPIPWCRSGIAREEFGMVRGNKELLYRFIEPPDSVKRR